MRSAREMRWSSPVQPSAASQLPPSDGWRGRKNWQVSRTTGSLCLLPGLSIFTQVLVSGGTIHNPLCGKLEFCQTLLAHESVLMACTEYYHMSAAHVKSFVHYTVIKLESCTSSRSSKMSPYCSFGSAQVFTNLWQSKCKHGINSWTT